MLVSLQGLGGVEKKYISRQNDIIHCLKVAIWYYGNKLVINKFIFGLLAEQVDSRGLTSIAPIGLTCPSSVLEMSCPTWDAEEDQ